MAPRAARIVRNSLLKKGFIEEEDGDHRRFRLCVGGDKANVRTRYSHGAKECNDYILGRMAKHLSLSRAQLDDLIDCRLGGEEYVEMLRGLGVVKT
jgi:hypothetical protein